MMAAMEAFGEALVVEPVLDHVALASRLVAQAGTATQRDATLPALLDGRRKTTFAYLERGRRYALEPATTIVVKSASGGWQLDGEKVVVIGAPLADVLVVSAQISHGPGCPVSGGTGLFLVETEAPGVAISAYRTIDGQRAGDITFNNVQLNVGALLGGEDTKGLALPQIEEAIDFATALLCADAVGAMKSANDATLEYLKTRKQFGIAIGSFQALQHRMVDMFMACEQARSMAILAACRVDEAQGATDSAAINVRKKAVSGAMVKIADSARLISQESVQLHGGMGMTEEMKVSHTFRRLTALAQRFGDADHHLARYAALN
jgi:alkylation response protein AidB-like acyl-CoA dehydrogenase